MSPALAVSELKRSAELSEPLTLFLLSFPPSSFLPFFRSLPLLNMNIYPSMLSAVPRIPGVAATVTSGDQNTLLGQLGDSRLCLNKALWV